MSLVRIILSNKANALKDLVTNLIFTVNFIHMLPKYE